ncbi:MAG: hypothetical protein CSA95_08305 [Bacteroidetes bacterium]|nr:MAG: hypothetical protein CSA95_08305 [Bacteroidota bacterium]
MFKKYLESGYLPFSQEGEFMIRLMQVIIQTLGKKVTKAWDKERGVFTLPWNKKDPLKIKADESYQGDRKSW